jgi:hypothetical protein
MDTTKQSTYNPEYCEKMVAYFNKAPFTRKNGYNDIGDNWKYDSKEEDRIEVTIYPTFEKFAADNMLRMDDIFEWKKEYPEFLLAYERSKLYQKNILIVNSLHNHYSIPFARIVAKNSFNMDEKNAEANDYLYPSHLNITFTNPPNPPDAAGREQAHTHNMNTESDNHSEVPAEKPEVPVSGTNYWNTPAYMGGRAANDNPLPGNEQPIVMDIDRREAQAKKRSRPLTNAEWIMNGGGDRHSGYGGYKSRDAHCAWM